MTFIWDRTDQSQGVYRAYVYAGAKLVAQQSYDGQFYWVHKDHLGSGHKLTNGSGAVVYRAEFDPHGRMLLEWSNPAGMTNLNSKKFAGYERDWATNLDYANARMYTHNRARFMQPDPMGLGCANKSPKALGTAHQDKPQSLNRYSYAWNDPINFVDPSGLDPEFIVNDFGGDDTICRIGCYILHFACLVICVFTGPFIIPCILSCYLALDLCLIGCRFWLILY
jgi:RHS repeat-associated protein